MSAHRIIYETEGGGVAVIVPTAEWLEANNGDLTALAAKDVPPGARWKIAPVEEIPADRTFRNAWEYVA